MNEDNVQDAQVVEKPVAQVEDLRIKVTNAKADFQKQITQVKEAIASREAELKNLNIKLLKLQGAVEASELYLQPSK